MLLYSRALAAGGKEAPAEAVLLSNRAAAHLRLENYGSAASDASKALELDPRYVKAYYRRADANFALGKVKLSLADFRRAAKVAPRDPDLRRKMKECEKAVQKIRFEEALAGPEAEAAPPASEAVDLEAMVVPDSYDGPRMEPDAEGRLQVSRQFVVDMMAHFKDQKMIHRRYAYEIVLRAQALFKELPSIVDVHVVADGEGAGEGGAPAPAAKHVTVCGDVHGQFYDLLNIFELGGTPSADNPYLFNGDFVDRGSFGVECALTLLAWKVTCPESLYLARGNHETHNMNKIYGFEGEVRQKFSQNLCDVFRETFCWLPVGHVLNGKVYVVHGGLYARDGVTLDELRAIDRNREPADEGLLCESLWSDPQPEPGRAPSKRGVGVAFGPDVTQDFLKTNDLSLVVRSHEVKDAGYEVAHGGYCVTIFSAPNYCDQMGNKGAFIRFEADMVPKFVQFSAVPHPPVRPMAYASNYMSMMQGF